MFTLFIYTGLLTMATDVVWGLSITRHEIPQGITIHKMISTWEEAKLQCQSEGAVIASPINTKLLNDMKTLISINNTPYLIGTRATHYSGPFISMEGIPLENMTVAMTEMIELLDPRNGDCLSMDQYSINVVPCCTRLPFMCYKAQDTTTTENTTTVSTEQSSESTTYYNTACGTYDKEYKYFESTGSCYKLHRDKKTWNEGQEVCVSEGGHLAVIDDHTEMYAVITFNLSNTYYTNVGLQYNTTDKEWWSVTGQRLEEIYNIWQSGRPTGGFFYCATIDPTGMLNNYLCNFDREYICEKEPTNKIVDETQELIENILEATQKIINS